MCADAAGVADVRGDNRSEGGPDCADGPAMTDALCLMVGLPTGALGGDALRCGGTSGDRVGVAGLGVVPVVTGATGGATDWRDDAAGAETEERADFVDDAAAVDCAAGCTGGRGALTGVDGAAAVDRTEGCTDGRGAETGGVCATAVDGVYG
jgi:hypothetical protein